MAMGWGRVCYAMPNYLVRHVAGPLTVRGLLSLNSAACLTPLSLLSLPPPSVLYYLSERRLEGRLEMEVRRWRAGTACLCMCMSHVMPTAASSSPSLYLSSSLRTVKTMKKKRK